MKLTANITLDELTKSQVAERKGINNNPNPTQIENLKALAINILQPYVVSLTNLLSLVLDLGVLS
jgi:NADH:ubiquinone oxidoreductase subunit 6 (subunit J)